MNERHATRRAYELTQAALWDLIEAQNYAKHIRYSLVSAILMITVRTVYGLMATLRRYYTSLEANESEVA